MSFSRLEDAHRGQSFRFVSLPVVVALFALPLISISAAQGKDTLGFIPSSVPGFSGYGQPSLGRLWPYEANSPEFLNALANSNATGVYKISGYNVSKPWQRRGVGRLLDDWTLSVAALQIPGTPPTYLDDPVNVTSANNSAKLGVDSTLGFAVTLQAPDSLIEIDDHGNKRVEADPTWGMCMYLLEPMRGDYGLDGQKFNNKTLTEESSCQGYLSQECIESLETEFYKSYTITNPDPTNPYGSIVQCQAIYLQGNSECGYTPLNGGMKDPVFGYGEDPLFWHNIPSVDGIPLQYANGSVTMSQSFRVSGLFRQQVEDQQRARRTGDEGPEITNQMLQERYRKKWDDMVLNVWPVVTVWMNATFDPDLTTGRDRRRAKLYARTRVSCVAPNGVGTGKAFTFSGQAPGSPLRLPSAAPPVSTGTAESGKENSVATSFELGPGKVSLLVWACGLTTALVWL